MPASKVGGDAFEIFTENAQLGLGLTVVFASQALPA